MPGTSPDRWSRVWRERLPDDPLDVVHAEPAAAVAAVLAGDVDAAVLRLPPAPADGAALTPPPGLPTTTPTTRDGWAVVPLWTETTVVVVPADHVLTVVDEVDVADLAGETLLVPADDVLGWTPAGVDVVEVPDAATGADLVASGAGLLVVPHAIARLHDRRGTTVRPVPDAPGSRLALVWRTDAEHPHAQELVGIVRGRTAGSSRGDATVATDAGRGTGRDGRSGRDGRGGDAPSPRRAGRPTPRTPGRGDGRPRGGGGRRTR
ncbi:LysR substrate-binding domain-containing protein [Cellulomonas iranensis]|uniref:LysR substrate-binding domain-containing protein n=1 Tax=Cellulomonas iranensis TaxID=76862 RepID=UPI003D7E8A5E